MSTLAGLTINDPVAIDYTVFRDGTASTASLPLNYFTQLKTDFPPTRCRQSKKIYIALQPNTVDTLNAQDIFTFADNNRPIGTVERSAYGGSRIMATKIQRMTERAECKCRSVVAMGCYNYNTNSVTVMAYILKPQ